MKLKLFALVFIALLAGCATKITYTFNHETFDDEYYFREAVTETNNKIKRAITPLPKPLTQRQLIIVMPDAATLAGAMMEGEKLRLKREPNSREIEMFNNVAWSHVESVRTSYETTKIRGIYSHVSMRETNSLTNNLAPSDTYDTLSYFEEVRGQGAWFYSSLKHGRQIFAFDRTSKDVIVNQQSFLSALQLLAIRE